MEIITENYTFILEKDMLISLMINRNGKHYFYGRKLEYTMFPLCENIDEAYEFLKPFVNENKILIKTSNIEEEVNCEFEYTFGFKNRLFNFILKRKYESTIEEKVCYITSKLEILQKKIDYYDRIYGNYTIIPNTTVLIPKNIKKLYLFGKRSNLKTKPINGMDLVNTNPDTLRTRGYTTAIELADKFRIRSQNEDYIRVLIPEIYSYNVYNKLNNFSEVNAKAVEYDNYDLTFLDDFDELEELYIIGNDKIIDFSFIANKKGLKTLFISNCNGLKNIDFINNMPNLINIKITNCDNLRQDLWRE